MLGFNRKSVMRVGSAGLRVVFAAALGVGALKHSAYAASPAVRIFEGVETAVTAYDGATIRTTALPVEEHPEIETLARSLRYDPILMFRYVHDTIETLPLFGSKGGALGALINKSGTSFDQAELLLALLRASDANGNTDFDAKFRLIRADLPQAQLTEVFDTGNASDACKTLQAGGFPFAIRIGGISYTDCMATPTTSFDDARILHVVVTADIGGATVVLDPSIKTQTRISGEIDLESVLGASGASLPSISDSGSAPGSYAFQGDLQADVSTALQDFSGELEDVLRDKDGASFTAGANYKLSTSQAFGGLEIEPSSDQPIFDALANLTYLGETIDGGPLDAIPDQYRTRIDISYSGNSISLFLDEISGRRVWLRENGTSMELVLGRKILKSWASALSGPISVTIDHPYGGSAGTAGDHTEIFNRPFSVGSSAALLFAGGETGLGTLGRLLDSDYQDLHAVAALTSVDDDDEALAQLSIGANYLAQQSQLLKLADGVMSSTSALHDVIVMVAGDDDNTITPYLDIRSQFSLVNRSGAQAEGAAKFTLTTALNALEGAVLDQTADLHGNNTSASNVSMIAKALADGSSLRGMLASNPNQGGILTNYTADELALIQSNSSDYVVLPSSGNVTVNGYTGTPYLIFPAGDDAVGHVIDDAVFSTSVQIKAGTGPQTPSKTQVEGATKTLESTVGFDSSVMPSASAPGFGGTDLIAGSGGFPYSLPYTRTYSVNADGLAGWKHNYDISAGLGSNGMFALGAGGPLQASSAVAALFATYDYLKSCSCDQSSKLEMIAMSSWTMTWMQKALRDNVLTVRGGHNATVYSKLSDGTYWPGPGGSISKSGTGANTLITMTMQSGQVMAFKATDSDARDFRLQTWSWPTGVTLSFTYQSDASGETWTVNNGATLGRELTIHKAADGNTMTAMDENNNEARLVAGAGRTMTVTRTGGAVHTIATLQTDNDGRVTRISTPEVTDRKTFNYDALGRMVSYTVKDRGTYYLYNSDWRSEVVGPGLPEVSSVNYSDPYGRFSVSQAGVENGEALHESRQEFDRIGRLVKMVSVKDAEGLSSTVEYTYDRYGHRLTSSATSKNLGGQETLTTTYSYHDADKLRQLATIRDPSGTVASVDYYTGSGLVKNQTVAGIKPAIGWTPVSLVTSYVYNTLGLPTLITAPDGTTTGFSYQNGLVVSQTVTGTDGESLSTTMSYTDEGDVATATDHRSNTTTFDYDDFRRQYAITGPAGSDVYSEYGFDADGRVTSVRYRKNVGGGFFSETRQYDDADRVVRREDFVGNATNISYDDEGRKISVTAPNGITTERFFDVLGRVDRVVRNTAADVQITEEMGYNADGTLAWVEDGRDTKTYFGYDRWNRRISTTYFGGGQETVDAFDAAGRPTQLTTRSNRTVTIKYNDIGWVLKRKISDGPIYNYIYDISGRVTKVFKTEDGNTTRVTYTHDGFGRLSSEKDDEGYRMGYRYDDAAGSYTLDYINKNGTTEYSAFYQTDMLGRVSEIRETGASGALIASYDYDPLSRITRLSFGNNAVQTYGYAADTGWLESLSLDANGDNDTLDEDDVTFTYSRDQLGRIKTEVVSNSAYVFEPLSAEANLSYLATPLNQYASITSATETIEPQYDAAGNLTFDGTFTYDWNAENQLVEASTVVSGTDVKVADYAYDALGRRTEKTVTAGNITTRYLWGGSTTYAELSGTGVMQRQYVYGPGIDEPLMVREADGSKNYVHRDGKNTVVAVSGTSGVSHIFTMDVFGHGSDAAISPYKFTSRRLDDETGNYYYRNRYYHPKQGRFMSNDPIGYADGLNMYAYAHNDPVNFRDMMGTCGTRIAGAEAANCRSVDGAMLSIMTGSSGATHGGHMSVRAFVSGLSSGSGDACDDGCTYAYYTDGGYGGATVTTYHGGSLGFDMSVASGGYVNTDCRACGRTGTMTASWQNGDDQASIYANARARQQQANVMLGYGQAWNKELRSAIATVATASSFLVGGGGSRIATSYGARVFWSSGGASGIMEGARAFAIRHGGQTLEMTMHGRALSIATKGMEWSRAAPMWQRASSQFAAGAQGRAFVYTGPQINIGSIYATLEFPILMRNSVRVIDIMH